MNRKDAEQRQNDAEEMHVIAREIAGRDGWIKWRMQDVPTIYFSLMPPSSDAKELYEAEKAIRRQMKADLKIMVRPWWPIGPTCQLLNLSNLTPQELFTIGAQTEPFLGMPAAVKPGFDHNGKPWMEYAEVEAALENANNSAARAASEKANALREAYDAANSAYVVAANEWANENPEAVAVDRDATSTDDNAARPWNADAKVSALKDQLDAAEKAYRAADADLQRLRVNPIAGAMPAKPATDNGGDDSPSMKIAD